MTTPATRKLNILVVDDEKSSAISVIHVLRQGGHAIDTAMDGAEAISRLKDDAQRYHILITDHAMLQVSGLELMLQLRGTGFHGRIMILSANLTSELCDTYRRLGADYILSKPFELNEMRTAVEDLAGKVDY